MKLERAWEYYGKDVMAIMPLAIGYDFYVLCLRRSGAGPLPGARLDSF